VDRATHVRRRPAAPLRALLALVALAAAPALAVAADYYPSGEGVSWTYTSGETQAFSGPRDLDGLAVMVLTHYLDGVPVSEDYLSFTSDGVFTHGTAAGGTFVRYDPPLLVYGAPPLQPGSSWSTTTELGSLSITLSAEVLGLRGVQTPAGRFNALQIRQRTLTSTGGRTLLDLFLVPGVGVVRFITEDGTMIDLIDRTD
jgi:hypothetical protein